MALVAKTSIALQDKVTTISPTAVIQSHR